MIFAATYLSYMHVLILFHDMSAFQQLQSSVELEPILRPKDSQKASLEKSLFVSWLSFVKRLCPPRFMSSDYS